MGQWPHRPQLYLLRACVVAWLLSCVRAFVRAFALRARVRARAHACLLACLPAYRPQRAALTWLDLAVDTTSPLVAQGRRSPFKGCSNLADKKCVKSVIVSLSAHGEDKGLCLRAGVAGSCWRGCEVGAPVERMRTAGACWER